MKRSGWYWIIGLALVLLLICGGFVGLGLLVAGNMGSSDGLAFGDAVAIVRVEGTILPGEAPPPTPFGSTSGTAFSQQIIDQLKKANDDPQVKAVILYVDSPGGSVFASDEIHLQVKKMEKPIIAAMGSLAASGGYYVSAPTNEIWASPHTLTCSIGVACWSMGDYREAEQWLLKAQAVQKQSGRVWLPELDKEVERIKALAAQK